jgi:heptaprenyl diphosphate synthase
MPSSTDAASLRKLSVIAVFASLAVVLGILESMIPFAVAVPGAKPGLGNILVLTCLWFFSGRDALWLIAVKTLLTAFILGTFSTFLFSIMGALASFLVMWLMLRFARHAFNLVSVSVAGGVAHNIGQLTAAAVVLGTSKIYFYLPVLLIAGVVTGVFVGLAARYLIGTLSRIGLFREMTALERDET